ncbi:MAG: hypothetical protein ABI137_06640 [Antricoccus sp.]
MSILIMLVLVVTSYLLTRLLMVAPHIGAAAPTRAHLARPAPPRGAATNTRTQHAVTWSALDDLQLIRLLTDAASTNDD